MHVPRTGGRNFFNCLLRNLFPKDQECPQSYRKLQFDLSEPGCRLVATHDDYSLMSMLPSKRTSVITIMRNPVDRVLSTYEFSIRAAARIFIHPNLSSSVRTKQRNFTKIVGRSTLHVWPWKYLLPWMRKDLFDRRDARDSGSMVVQGVVLQGNVDPYNFPAMSMPLDDYIYQPLAYDIIHNGGTFQVAGLTNNSHLEEAQEIRQCVMRYPYLGKHVLKVAKKRLDEMFYVGLTENHKDSARILANMFGIGMLSHLQTSNFSFPSSHVVSNKTGLTKETSQAQITVEEQKSNINSAIDNANERKRNMSSFYLRVGSILKNYEKCAFITPSSQSQHHISLLNPIARDFTKKGRTRIPESTIREIERLNSLDVELFKHGRNIFSQQQRALNQHKTFPLHESSLPENNVNSRISSRQSTSSVWPFLMFPLIATVVVIRAARGRSFKIKL